MSYHWRPKINVTTLWPRKKPIDTLTRQSDQTVHNQKHKKQKHLRRGMLLLSQAPNLSAKRCSLSSPPLNPKFTNPKPFLFSNRKPKLTATSKPLNLTLAKPEGGIDSSSATKPTTPFHNDQTVFVGQENVPLEGVIQFDKPTLDSSFSSRLNKWGLVFIAKLCSFKKKKNSLMGFFV